MKLQTQFTVPNKELKDLDYFKKVVFFEDIFLAIIHNLRFFLIFNPFNFVPLTAKI